MILVERSFVIRLICAGWSFVIRLILAGRGFLIRGNRNRQSVQSRRSQQVRLLTRLLVAQLQKRHEEEREASDDSRDNNQRAELMVEDVHVQRRADVLRQLLGEVTHRQQQGVSEAFSAIRTEVRRQ